MHSIIRDEHGRLVPVVRPKLWQAASVKRSRDRTDCIARARKQRKAWLATTQWMNELDRRGICRTGSDRHPVGVRRTLARRAGPARGLCGADGREAGLADAGGR